jgi:predicted RNA polymerase sigma factor
MDAWRPQQPPGAHFRDGEIDALYAYLGADEEKLRTMYFDPRVKLEESREAARLRLSGLSTPMIAREMGVSRAAIDRRIERCILIGKKLLTRVPRNIGRMTLMKRLGWEPLV